MTVITNRRTVIAGFIILLGFLLAYLGWGDRKNHPDSPSLKIDQAAQLEPVKSTGVKTQGQPFLTAAPALPAQAGMAPKSQEDSFAEYRLELDRVRSREIEMLKQILDNPSSPAEIRQSATSQLMNLSQRMEQEKGLEALVAAKGYKEAAAFVQSGAVVLVVKASSLTQEDATKIADLAARITGQPMEKINIIVKK